MKDRHCRVGEALVLNPRILLFEFVGDEPNYFIVADCPGYAESQVGRQTFTEKYQGFNDARATTRGTDAIGDSRLVIDGSVAAGKIFPHG